MPAGRLDHCVIAVSNWERSNAFYRDVVGAELVPMGPDRVAYRLGETQLNVHGPGAEPSELARVPVEAAEHSIAKPDEQMVPRHAGRNRDSAALRFRVPQQPRSRSGWDRRDPNQHERHEHPADRV